MRTPSLTEDGFLFKPSEYESRQVRFRRHLCFRGAEPKACKRWGPQSSSCPEALRRKRLGAGRGPDPSPGHRPTGLRGPECWPSVGVQSGRVRGSHLVSERRPRTPSHLLKLLPLSSNHNNSKEFVFIYWVSRDVELTRRNSFLEFKETLQLRRQKTLPKGTQQLSSWSILIMP